MHLVAYCLLLVCFVPGVVVDTSTAEEPFDSASFPVPQPTSQKATLTFEQLRTGVKEYYATLWAVEVKYEFVTATPGNSSIHQLWHYAYRHEKRLKSSLADNQRYTYAFDGTGFVNYPADRKMALINKKKSGYVDVDPFIDALGIPLKDLDRATVARNPDLMPSALFVSEFDWSLRPNLEIVDGAKCHVLVSGATGDQMWIDPELGFARRFWQQRVRTKKVPLSERPFNAQYAYRAFMECQKGVWLPTRNEIIAYAPASQPRDRWNTEARKILHKVTYVAIGQRVADKVFSVAFEVGTNVNDEVNKRFYRMGNSGEELDVLVGEGLAEIHSTSGRRWLVMLSVGVLSIVIIMAVYRIARNPRSSAPS